MTADAPRRALDEATINELESAGDIAALARALRNVIVITDEATRSAMAAARERQEYVPTTLLKDSIYRALDAALTPDAFVPDSALFVEDEDGGQHAFLDAARAFEDVLAITEPYDEVDEVLPEAFSADDLARFTGASLRLVGELVNLGWLDRPTWDQTDSQTRGSTSAGAS